MMSRYRGFTLIELIISVGLFAIISTLAAGGYLITIAAARHAEVETAAVDNLSFAFETMMRIVRTGSGYLCNGSTNPCNPGSTFTVTGADGNTYVFAASGGAITEQITAPPASVQPATAITDPAVAVSAFNIYMIGAGASDGQTHVTFVITGIINNVDIGKQIPFTLETGATTRTISP